MSEPEESDERLKELESWVTHWFKHTVITALLGIGFIVWVNWLDWHGRVPEIFTWIVCIGVSAIAGYCRRKWKHSKADLQKYVSWRTQQKYDPKNK